MATPKRKSDDHYLTPSGANMKTTLGALKLCLVGVVVAVGIGSAQARRILGYGLSSCGAWTQARNANATERLSMEHWVAGYLSNFNSLNDEDSNIPDLLKDQEWGSIMAWIDTYCAAHPLDKVDRAARTLELELLGHHLAPR
jgi:hypothetical protein